jgi:cholesterol oxidase
MDGNRSRSLGFTFTETMGGNIVAGQEKYVRKGGEPLRFTVTILVDDLKSFVQNPAHEARMTGHVDSPRFGGRQPLEDGVFNLFAKDESGRMQMRYDMRFRDSSGIRHRLTGYKDVHNDFVLDFWKDTTTLFATLYRENNGTEEEVGRGVLTIRLADLVPQVLSMRAINARHPGQHVSSLVRFGTFFTAKMLGEYASAPRRNK